MYAKLLASIALASTSALAAPAYPKNFARQEANSSIACCTTIGTCDQPGENKIVFDESTSEIDGGACLRGASFAVTEEGVSFDYRTIAGNFHCFAAIVAETEKLSVALDTQGVFTPFQGDGSVLFAQCTPNFEDKATLNDTRSGNATIPAKRSIFNTASGLDNSTSLDNSTDAAGVFSNFASNNSSNSSLFGAILAHEAGLEAGEESGSIDAGEAYESVQEEGIQASVVAGGVEEDEDVDVDEVEDYEIDLPDIGKITFHKVTKVTADIHAEEVEIDEEVAAAAVDDEADVAEIDAQAEEEAVAAAEVDAAAAAEQDQSSNSTETDDQSQQE